MPSNADQLARSPVPSRPTRAILGALATAAGIAVAVLAGSPASASISKPVMECPSPQTSWCALDGDPTR